MLNFDNEYDDMNIDMNDYISFIWYIPDVLNQFVQSYILNYYTRNNC